MARRDYGAGSIYQRASDGRWIGTFEDGWTAQGTRRRRTVSAKTEAECKRRLRDKRLAADRGETGASERTTVKAWAETYLDMRRRDLSPKGWNAAASPIRKWIVPTIGHRRLTQLTPADVRAVADAQRAAGRQPADTHRVLKTMLKAAIAEGHGVPERLLHIDAPKSPPSDRQAMSVDEGLACLEIASTLPHGSRWLFNMLYGARLNECLGLTWDAIDFDAGPYGEAIIEWQLQALPYEHRCAGGDSKPSCGRTKRSCPRRGFRVPDNHEARHLVDAFHLVRPKSRSGYRVAPLLKPVSDALLAWRHVAPANPHGLVWPNLRARPANDKDDRAEWHALQQTAGVAHPTRLQNMIDKGAKEPHGQYHIHECRNFAATMLLEADVPEHVVTDLLGHSTVATSLRYRTRRRAPLLAAMERVGERLQLG